MININKINSNAGVTLIEVILSFAIAGVAMFSMMMLFPKMEVLVDVASHKVAAVRACQQKIEDVRRDGFSNTFAGVTNEVVTLDSGQNLGSNADDLLGVLTTTITDIVVGPDVIAKKVLVQCQWNEHRVVVNEYLDFVLYRNIT